MFRSERPGFVTGSESDNPKRWTETSAYLVAATDDSLLGGKHDAPAVRRNCEAILAVLTEFLPETGTVLEIASGTGQHVTAFAGANPNVTWLPSDPDPRARSSIEAWVRSAGVGNVRPPANIDVTRSDWVASVPESVHLILCINLLQISPWTACEGLMAGAAKLLKPGGQLFIYGCFKRGGQHTAASNERFHESLVYRNPQWGVRDLEAVIACARVQGLVFEKIMEMPVNNLSVAFRQHEEANQ